MKKILTMAVGLLAFATLAWESTLTTNSVLIVPSVNSGIGVADRQASEEITAGDIRKVGNTVVVAQNDGTTSALKATNTVTTSDVNTLVVTGTLAPDATGSYIKTDVGTYTNSAKAWMIWVSAGQYRMTTNANYRTASTNRYYNTALIGSYTNGGAYTGVATVAYKTVTTPVITAVAPTVAATGVTVDGSVSWLKVPASRKALVLDVLNGDAVLTSANGDKLYVNDRAELLDFAGALYGASTNSAKVEIFQY